MNIDIIPVLNIQMFDINNLFNQIYYRNNYMENVFNNYSYFNFLNNNQYINSDYFQNNNYFENYLNNKIVYEYYDEYDLENMIIEVKDITMRACVERELMLIKVSSSKTTRSEILEIVEIFRSKVVDLSENSITVEVTGDPGKIITIQELLSHYEIIEIVRTGKISLERELGINTEYLKNN
jgi:hypothetical protein